MINFKKLSPSEIAAFVVAHQSELDAGGITVDYVVGKLQSGTAALESREYGFALIELTPAKDGKSIPFLWVLYVDETRRGAGLGHRFMREIMRKYATDHHLSLYCSGARRRKFFGRLGFRIESREGEMRRMTTNDWPLRY